MVTPMKLLYTHLYCSLVLSTSLFSQAVVAQDIDLLLLAGQSNSVGRASPVVDNGVAIPGSSPLDARVRYYFDVDNTGGSAPADSGQTFGPLSTYLNPAFNRDELGHEFAVSRGLVETRNADLAVIKFAVGGANISRWQPGAVDYTGFINAVTDGVEELIDDGFNVNIVGLAWLQGESDARATRAPLYAGRLNNFVSGARNDLNTAFPTLGFDLLPVVLVEPAQLRGASADVITNLNIVDAALINFAATDSSAAFVQTSDIDGYIDSIHFNAQAQQTIGERIANALNDISPPDGPAASQISISDARVREGDGSATVTLSLDKTLDRDQTVLVYTQPKTAINGEDFYGIAQNVEFTAGTLTQEVQVQILDDDEIERYEYFSIHVHVPQLDDLNDLSIARKNGQINVFNDDF